MVTLYFHVYSAFETDYIDLHSCNNVLHGLGNSQGKSMNNWHGFHMLKYFRVSFCIRSVFATFTQHTQLARNICKLSQAFLTFIPNSCCTDTTFPQQMHHNQMTPHDWYSPKTMWHAWCSLFICFSLACNQIYLPPVNTFTTLVIKLDFGSFFQFVLTENPLNSFIFSYFELLLL